MTAINIHYIPGRHDSFSPITGKRAEELRHLRQQVKEKPSLAALEKALHGEGCGVCHLYLIPIEKREEADAIAKDLLKTYLAPYADKGITLENAVDWTPGLYWSTRFGGASPGITILKQQDRRNDLKWHIHAAVNEEGGLSDTGKHYLPRHVIAYHEIQHIEEHAKDETPDEYMYRMA